MTTVLVIWPEIIVEDGSVGIRNRGGRSFKRALFPVFAKKQSYLSANISGQPSLLISGEISGEIKQAGETMFNRF